MRTVTTDEHARRLVAYQQTANDADAAAALGVQVVTFRAWRRVQGLPAKQVYKPKRPNSRRPRVKLAASVVADVAARLDDERMERIRRLLPR